MEKSPEIWLRMREAGRESCRRGVLGAFEEHQSASNQFVKMRRIITQWMGQCDAMVEDGEVS
jgi:hypothetical protein